ncbi:MAG: hypothetical protein K0M70_08640, partial [Arenimonas sp.]|nr:hypothetical protein [Arenimonas sp.]
MRQLLISCLALAVAAGCARQPQETRLQEPYAAADAEAKTSAEGDQRANVGAVVVGPRPPAALSADTPPPQKSPPPAPPPPAT